MLSAASETAVVAALSHEGVGVVHGGKAAFVSGALPGETIRFRRRRPHRQYDEAELEEVLEPSADRVEPRCLHFDICGGCALQHLAAPAQLQLKEQLLRESLERIARTSPARWLPAVAGRVWGYRRRARLSAKFVEGKGRVLVGFRERLSSLIASIDRCEVLAAPLDGMIRSLSDLIMQLSIRERLPQIEVAVADNAVALVLRVLEPPTAGDLERLRAFETQHGVRFYLQSGGLESVRSLTEPAAVLTYALPEADLELEFAPTDFIQVNGEVNRALVHAAVELLELDGSSRVLDLYCGLGNFSLAIARRAQAVVGIEGDSALVERAQSNARRNGLSNAEFHRADLSTELSGARWLAQPYTHVLLDPPRAGARELLPQLARLAPTRLLYVSCHPGTLARDIGELVHQHGFELLAAGVVDMFAHTAHMESLALLAPRRRR
jgi:23S rRNA (uracil1939-C5)-methyltransferase